MKKRTSTKSAAPTKRNITQLIPVEFVIGMDCWEVELEAVPRLFEHVSIQTAQGLVHGRVSDIFWRVGFTKPPRASVHLGSVTLPTAAP